MNKDDQMPDINSAEYGELKQRALKLSHADICELLELSGIAFESSFKNDTPAGLPELLAMSKEDLLEPLDEARSRQELEHFLETKGV